MWIQGYLYSPIEKIHIKTKNHKKTFIANNTIVFDEELYPVKENKNVLKNEFGIRSRFNILFVGRDTKIKKLDLIIETVKSLKNEDIGLLIVSPLRNINKTLESIKGYDQIRYLGEIYDKTALSKIYWISDIFCIPGANGLGLNEAMFWGLPCLTLKALHGPEIWYLKNRKMDTF